MNPFPAADTLTEKQIIALISAWVEHVVIGLNLCPFAKPVHTFSRIFLNSIPFYQGESEVILRVWLALLSRKTKPHRRFSEILFNIKFRTIL